MAMQLIRAMTPATENKNSSLTLIGCILWPRVFFFAIQITIQINQS
jgi:hypothetical protein